MPANERLADLTAYTGVLPYASELFGVYQPLLGWRSKRVLQRIQSGATADAQSKLLDLARLYRGDAQLTFNVDHQLEAHEIRVGQINDRAVRPAPTSLLLTAIGGRLADATAPHDEEWRAVIDRDRLTELLNGTVFETYRSAYQAAGQPALAAGAETGTLQEELTGRLRRESAIAGLLLDLVEGGHYAALNQLFFAERPGAQTVERALAALENGYKDPFLAFDPTKSASDVSLSPLGIVHLFRQYFFELDSFVGTPVGHVWLSPGSMVELIEISTRRTLVDKSIETTLETTTKTEKSTTEEDEISDAVKQDNKDDLKLGFSATVNQSWGTGNATATGTLNMDKTQETAREQGHKRMRQQSEKLSTEIRQNFKSTFRTVTETTDTSTKRYVLNNTTADLINYELRRKMRQVGVQIQDVGTYLCWETFVDDPGAQLALPNLIHIAKPADLVLVPNPKLMPVPPDTVSVTFSGEAVWNFPDNTSQHQEDHPETNGQFVPIATLDIPGIPADYEVAYDPSNPYIAIDRSVVAADDDSSWNAVNWGFKGMITPDAKRVMVGVSTMPKPNGIAWDDRITFKVSGAVTCRLTPAKRAEIDSANDALISAKLAADQENQRKLEQAYLDSVKERVTLASKITKRKFEDLREEERTIVYRNLIQQLLTEQLYRNTPDTPAGFQTRHVLSELINAIFDIEKMLYFVAPEWWKPRRTASLSLGGAAIPDSINGSVVRWANDQAHDKYFITNDADPAALGSSLGWLLQLDGDDLRNAFLNAPWVKAVIPVRPGKEQVAINWLTHVGVEGADGLDAAYNAPPAELTTIRAKLLERDPNDPVDGHANVTIEDALRYLCIIVAEKADASNTVGRYPEDEINDDNRVSATPIEKVFEHGFYPLKGGFKARTEEPFEICSQWIEVLPTDQVVPVPVKYDSKTGRQV